MNCLKCGCETDEKQVFCDNCLKEAEKYPIKPGTTIYIPAAPAQPVEKRAARAPRAIAPEAQIQRLRRTVQVLLWVLTALLIAFALTTMMLIHMIEQRDQAPIGQNFGTTPTSTSAVDASDVSRETDPL